VRLRRYPAARRDYDAVLSREPHNLRALLGRARLASLLGDAEGAAADFRRVLDLVPGFAPALAGMLTLKGKAGDDETLLREARRRLAEGGLPEAQVVELGYAVAKRLDQHGLHADAFAAAARANDLQAGRAPFAPARISRQLALDEQIGTLGEGEEVRPYPAPILVCGLPRSGTSLVEQVLARHPEVAAGGEIPFFRNAADWLSRQHDPAQTLADERSELRRGYGAALAERAVSGEAFVIDKMPENWRHLGLVTALYGRAARVVWVHREPRDVAVSIFLEHFAAEEAFAHSAEGIRTMIRHEQTRRRLTRERTADPAWSGPSVVFLRYENLVGAPDGEIPRLLAALDLRAHAACLRPHESVGAVATPSRWQVREPINTRAVGRWRNYRGPLTDLFAAVAGKGESRTAEASDGASVHARDPV
jgi:tetratricopeptide (TPR) repeat protein